MGVRPPQGLSPAVQIIPHGPLLAGGLGVKIHQHQIGVHPLQRPVGRGKRVFQIAVHLAPADEVEHPDPQPLRAVEDSPAPAGDTAGVVGRAEDIAVVLQVVGNLKTVPCVIAQCDDVGSGGKDGVCLPGMDAHPGGILPVDNGKMDILQLLQSPQVPGKKLQSGVPHHIAHGQYI